MRLLNSLFNRPSIRPTKTKQARLRLESLSDRIAPATGALDDTFGTAQAMLTQIGSSNDIGRALATQADGKMVVAGSSVNGSFNDFSLVRHNVNGSLDKSFDGDGKVVTSFGSINAGINKLAIQADGKIVAAGYSHNGTDFDLAVARYNADGSLDPTFDGDGKLTVHMATTNESAHGLAIQPDGKIVLAGYYRVGTAFDILVTRFNPDGSLDAEFDGDGKLTTAIGPGDEYANALALQSDGKIVVAGQSNANGNFDFAVVRYNPDGSLDTQFDGDGKLTTPIGPALDSVHTVAIQDDGKIVVAGQSLVYFGFGSSCYNLGVARYNADGSLDTSFAVTGKFMIANNYENIIAHDMEIQADGKFFLAGTAGTNKDFMLMVINPDGTRDVGFSGDGFVSSAIGSGDESAQAVAIQSDGKIVVAGYSNNGSNHDFAMMRFTSDGRIDPLVDGSGFLTTDIGTANDSATAMAIQPDGKMVVAGTSFNGSSHDFALTRYNVDGTLDTSFHADGKQTTDFGGTQDFATCVAIQADGKIVVAGYSIPFSAICSVARYNSDGTLDTTFGVDGKMSLISNMQAYGVAIQPDGKIVIVGGVGDSNKSIAVLRLNTDGTQDPTFDGDGYFTASNPTYCVATSVVIQPNNKILVAGYSYSGGTNYDFSLLRLNPTGTLDTSFDGDGKLTTDFGLAADLATSIAIQADDKIVLGGRSDSLGTNDFALVRYNPNGSLDTSFDFDGRVITQVGQSNDDLTGIAIQPDGKIVAAGHSEIGTERDFAVVRYNADGSLDSNFDNDGKLLIPISPRSDLAAAVAIQADGRIVVAGSSVNVSNTDFALARIRGDNRAPLALPATMTLAEDSVLNVPGASYYSDADGDLVTPTLLAGPAHGTLNLTPYGNFTYTPNADYNGIDSFTYRVTDTEGASNVGVVSFNVLSMNDDPVARDDYFAMSEDGGEQPIFVLANDSTAPDVGETMMLLSYEGGPQHGKVLIRNGTHFLYIPDSNFAGADSFGYTFDDGHGGTASATVHITVSSVNEPPIATNDIVTLAEDGGAQSIEVLANDSISPDVAELMEVIAVTQGMHGTVSISDGGFGITYTPNANYTGTDSFLYTISDGNGDSAVAAVTVHVANDLADRLEVVTSGGYATFTEHMPPQVVPTPVLIDAGLQIGSALEGAITSATVQITGGFVSKKDTLTFATMGSIKGKFNAKTGTLTLTGVASPADYQAALRTVKYTNPSATPVDGMRAILFTVKDAAGSGDPAVRMLRVEGVNTKPTLTLKGADLTYKTPGKALAVASTLKITDVDNTRLMGATITLFSGSPLPAVDLLSVKTKAGITATFNNGVLSLTGNASLKDYLAVLKTLKFTTTAASLPGVRTLSISVTDGLLTSDAVTRKVTV